MNPIKMKLLDELLGHLNSSQGKDLKDLIDQMKMKEMKEKPMDEAMESPEEQMMEDKLGTEMHAKPKGISVEKVSIMGKPKMDSNEKEDMAIDDAPESMPGKMSDHEEMSDDELEELLKKLV